MPWPIKGTCGCGCGVEIIFTRRMIRLLLCGAFASELADGISDVVIDLLGDGRMTLGVLNHAIAECRREDDPALMFAAFLDQFRGFAALHPGLTVRPIDVRLLLENASLIAACGVADIAETRDLPPVEECVGAWWPPNCRGGE